MAHPYHHALSSSKKFGGVPEDYLAIHQWFDQTKAHLPDVRHRAVLHSSLGIFLCEQVFGATLTNSTGKKVPVRLIGEQHVMEDCGGKIPTVQDWLEELPIRPWMIQGARRLSREPLDPVLSREPLDPVLSREPLDPVLSREPLDPVLSREPLDPESKPEQETVS